MAKKKYRKAIWCSKKNSWDNLIKSLDQDPWGLAYKIAFKKLRLTTNAVTETLPPDIVDNIIGGLFPSATDFPLDRQRPHVWMDEFANWGWDEARSVETFDGQKSTGSR